MESKEYHKQYQARNLYLHTDKTQKEIADLLDVNSKTLYLWIKHNRWEEIKIAARQAPMCMVQDMYNHISAINHNIYSREDQCPTPTEVDMLKKLAGTAKLLEAKNLGLYTETFMELISFIRASNPSLAFDVTAIADRYIKAKITKMQRFTPGDDLRAAQENLKAQESEEEKELKKQEAEEITRIITEDLKKNPIVWNKPVPNAVGGATSHQPIEPLSHCAIQPSDKSRAQSGITSQTPKPQITNKDNTSTKNTNSPIPKKTVCHPEQVYPEPVEVIEGRQTKKHHHYHNPRFMKRAS